jgi:transposase
LEVPVNKAYKELNLAYNTTHKIYNRIRQCIFKFVSEDDEFLSGEVEMDESYFGGRRKVKRGSIIYTDKFKAYDGLVMYGFKHERIDKSIKFSNGKVYINGIEGFCSYAKERLLKFPVVSKGVFCVLFEGA